MNRLKITILYRAENLLDDDDERTQFTKLHPGHRH